MDKQVDVGRSRAFSCDQVCRFFVQKKCLRGDQCPFSHDLSVEPVDEDSGSCCVSGEDTQACGICLQSVLAEGRRFGLLPRCAHVFCLDCITAWRNRSRTVVSRESARLCPICRIPSYFVIPSYRFVAGEPKRRRVEEYLALLAERPCMYYSASAHTELCPYGPLCFFRHQAPAAPDLLREKVRLVYTDGCAVWPPSVAPTVAASN